LIAWAGRRLRLENSKIKNSFENKKIPVYFNIWVLICSKTIESNCHIPVVTGKVFFLPVPVETVRLGLTGRYTSMNHSSFFWTYNSHINPSISHIWLLSLH
jgi:hypothetical protein